jgi:hypothetical protein
VETAARNHPGPVHSSACEHRTPASTIAAA